MRRKRAKQRNKRKVLVTCGYSSMPHEYMPSWCLKPVRKVKRREAGGKRQCDEAQLIGELVEALEALSEWDDSNQDARMQEAFAKARIALAHARKP